MPERAISDEEAADFYAEPANQGFDATQIVSANDSTDIAQQLEGLARQLRRSA